MTKTFDEFSFTKAKRVCFDALVAAVGTVRTIPRWTAKEGKNSFLGHLPPAWDVWALTIGGGGRSQQTWNTTPPWEMHMNGDIEGQFREQEAADEVGMKLISVLDLAYRNDAGEVVAAGSGSVRVQHFRIRQGGTPDVFLDYKPIANEGPVDASGKRGSVPLWVLKIGLELVFNTWNGSD